jgi:thiamine-monophosphate kinase
LVAVTIAEKALIAQIRRVAARAKNPAIRTGIGDDCAVLRLVLGRGKNKNNKNKNKNNKDNKNKNKNQDTDNDVLVTADFSLEEVHFRRDWHSPESIGHRCLARGLSDIAAMGGKPVAAFLSLALPADIKQDWIRRFVQGLIELAERYRVTLAGGDTAKSPKGILADIVVVGTAPSGRAVLRSGARPGDRIYVSGGLGGSAAAVRHLRKKRRSKPNPREYPRQFFPEPRIELGRMLREKGLASAMIDTSDGLSTDLAHICEESRVGAELQAGAIPRATVGKPSREVDLQLALHGGEDYELLFTSPPGKRIPSRIAGIPITLIGHITRARTISLRDPGGIGNQLEPHGWEHFRKQ